MATIALYFMHYNFSRVDKTLKTSPAVASALTDHVWAIEEVLFCLTVQTDTLLNPALS